MGLSVKLAGSSSSTLPPAFGTWPTVLNDSKWFPLTPGVFTVPTNVFVPPIVPTAICGVAVLVGPSHALLAASCVSTATVAAATTDDGLRRSAMVKA